MKNQKKINDEVKYAMKELKIEGTKSSSKNLTPITIEQFREMINQYKIIQM